jgi:hypothetical protein
MNPPRRPKPPSGLCASAQRQISGKNSHQRNTING